MSKKSIPRVLQVFSVLNRGGAETMIMNYYRNIDRTKIQFDFLVHRSQRGVYEDEIESLGGKIYRMPEITLFNITKYNNELSLFLKSNKYDIIHSHINTFSRYPLAVAKKAKIQCRIIHAHTTTHPLSVRLILSQSLESLKTLYKNIQKIGMTKFATHLFSCGSNAGTTLFGYNSNFQIINNAIDASKFSFNEDVVLRKTDINLHDSKVIGHIGNFSFPKNYPFLLSIFKVIHDRCPNYKLLLVGDGKQRQDIELLTRRWNISDSVIFTGVRTDIPELLQMMDVFVFPSLYEGLPVTLIEAQAAGLKIFASDAITQEVSLTDDINFLSLKESPDYWAERILESVPYERKNRYEEIKSGGYDIVENAKRLQDFYLEQINIAQ